ncbi:MAG: NADH dehydrogenase (quinone) subunit D [Caldilineaceae bacterium]|nr:NADH dehydrogenase (quinone) subunit D [Caldilineaceae bacterium]
MPLLNVSPVDRLYETLPNLDDISIPARAPQPDGETEDTQAIAAAFGDRILAAGLQHDLPFVHVAPADLRDLVTWLRDGELAYTTLIDVTSVDLSELPDPDPNVRFQTVYFLRSLSRHKALFIVCPLPGGDDAEAPSLAGQFPGAIWPEREVMDLMGIRFADHPDPRRILMPAAWPNHPLRKDVPLGGEDVPFSLTWDHPEFDGLGDQILDPESLPPDLPPGMNRQNMILNMGPHHPSTHGVLRLVVELDGERVVNVDPDLGYLHSGFEKTGEHRRYKDFVYYTDRMDYLSAMNNNLGYVLAIEGMLDLEIPARAQAIRVIMSEMQRIASHLFWLSTHVLDISGNGMSLLMYATRERERILDLFEMVCGARLTTSYIRIGGVWQDLPEAFLGALSEFCDLFPGRIDEYRDLVKDSPIWRTRLEGIGMVDREDALAMGLTGPMLRGSGVDWDLRRDQPYSGYEQYEFDVPTSDRGDGFGRYEIRMEEMRQSVRIIRQALDRLPDGLYRSDDRKVNPPPRTELDVSMESLIHHFKLFTEGFKVPPGMYYHGIEASKGELGFFIYSDGSGKPYRLHVRGPSFNNLYAIGGMSRGLMLSDIITNIGSIDIVLGEVDR